MSNQHSEKVKILGVLIRYNPTCLLQLDSTGLPIAASILLGSDTPLIEVLESHHSLFLGDATFCVDLLKALNNMPTNSDNLCKLKNDLTQRVGLLRVKTNKCVVRASDQVKATACTTFGSDYTARLRADPDIHRASIVASEAYLAYYASLK